MIRLARLLRLLRMARLLRSVPELLTLVKGMQAAARAVGSTLILLVLLIYVYAIIFLALVGENDALWDYFGRIGFCMWTLLLAGTFLDDLLTLRGYFHIFSDALAPQILPGARGDHRILA